MRNAKNLRRIRSLPCALAGTASCHGMVHAHHNTGGRGLALKSDDNRAFPLCSTHHHDFHSATGPFMDWTKAQRKTWQDEMSERYNPTREGF